MGVSCLFIPTAASLSLLDTSESPGASVSDTFLLVSESRCLSPVATSPRASGCFFLVTATYPEGCPRLPQALLVAPALSSLGSFLIPSVHYLASRPCSDSFFLGPPPTASTHPSEGIARPTSSWRPCLRPASFFSSSSFRLPLPSLTSCFYDLWTETSHFLLCLPS